MLEGAADEALLGSEDVGGAQPLLARARGLEALGVGDGGGTDEDVGDEDDEGEEEEAEDGAAGGGEGGGEELVKVELAKEQQAEAADGAGEGVPPRGLG